jgi:thiol-disulfide isomerase/thioredoxin
LLQFINMIQGEEGVEGVYGFVCWTSWSSLFKKPIRISTLIVWGEWCPNLKKTLWVIRKKEYLFRWLACATFPLLINIYSNYPTSFFFYKKCVNIREVDVSSLGFKVSSKLGGYIFWFYIDFNLFGYCNDSIRACKVVLFCSIWCWAPIVLGHELGQAINFSLCPFYGDQI